MTNGAFFPCNVNITLFITQIIIIIINYYYYYYYYYTNKFCDQLLKKCSINSCICKQYKIIQALPYASHMPLSQFLHFKMSIIIYPFATRSRENSRQLHCLRVIIYVANSQQIGQRQLCDAIFFLQLSI